MTCWTLVRNWIASGAREPNVSKAKGTKTCWFSAQALACLSTFFDSAFLAACPATNPFSLKPTRGETPVRSTQACFPLAHPKTSRSAGRRVDLPSIGSVRKFTGASFLDEIPALLRMSHKTSRTQSCRYLNPGSSLQCTACSPYLSIQALRHIGHVSSSGYIGIISRYLRIALYSTADIHCPSPSIGITVRKS
ncbi:hypothetical protein HanRHA438_Chr11g0519331 [Helianthus annuus]|nr:hypothetical protein HanRHA438_Chr11g0519331 [Helianthus annuus]